jgi:hypothetical protein
MPDTAPGNKFAQESERWIYPAARRNKPTRPTEVGVPAQGQNSPGTEVVGGKTLPEPASALKSRA